MKKICSLVRASMTSDMNIFKIKQKKDNKKNSFMLPFVLSIFFMFAIWSYANMFFEKFAPMHLQVIVISLVVFLTSIMVIIEGVYKAGPLLFNCRDDQLLLSLPIKKRTILFVRMLKFYLFELLFNGLFFIPLIVAYLRWGEVIDWSFFLTSFLMLFMLPIIPIAIACVIGAIISSISSRFKYKNFIQIVLAMLVILFSFYLSYNMDFIFNYIAKNATSINDFIMKLYYPAGVYSKLITNFNFFDLIIFILINIIVFILTIFILSKFYFQINSRLKNINTSSNIKIDNLLIKSRPKIFSFIRKELNSFFKTPVFVINAGFALVMYIVAVIGLCIKYNDTIALFNGYFPNIVLDNYLSIIILILISFASFMTSITNSVISLEGNNINLLKSLPISVKNILMSKIYSALCITTPPILIGDIILFIRFRVSIVEMILLVILSILIPLISHFIGLIINLKYPKLDYENSSEVVKQSTSSFLSVTIGMLLFGITIFVVIKSVELIGSVSLLSLFLVVYFLIDIILYIYLIKVSINDFNELSI